MKKILLLATVLLIGCKKNDNAKTVNTYQEAYYEYLNYTCPGNVLAGQSAPSYLVPHEDNNSSVKFDQNIIYAVSGNIKTQVGVYTSSYIVFDSNLSDTLSITTNTPSLIVAQGSHPVPCTDHTITRYTFQQ